MPPHDSPKDEKSWIGTDPPGGRTQSGQRTWPHSFQGDGFPLGAFHSPRRLANRGPIHVLVFPSTTMSAQPWGLTLFQPVTLREKGNPWQQLWAETEHSSPGAHNLHSPPILFHYLQASPAAQVPDTVGNFLHCIPDRTMGTFPNKKQESPIWSASPSNGLVGKKQLHTVETRPLLQPGIFKLPQEQGPGSWLSHTSLDAK